MNRAIEIIAKIIIWTLGIGWACIFGVLLVRAFVCDQFIVPSESMTPTLIPGDRILANKLVAGARIYKRFDFGEDIPLESFRMPGLRRVEVNDIVVFNAPYGYERKRIEFKINYVYAKRCIGTPGDSVSIDGSRFRNSRFDGAIGDTMQQRRLAMIPDSMFSRGVMRAFPADDRLFGWTIKDMGPLYVPQAGDTVTIDERNAKLYRLVIEYETGSELKFADGRATLDGAPLERYVFRQNYYYFCGDNVVDSKDSRYLGFVPEEFIIGVVRRISYSRDRYTDRLRWNRTWRNTSEIEYGR